MRDLIFKHKGAFIGGIIGLIIALLILIIGFWKAVLVFLLIGAGIFIGMVIDGNTTIKNSINKFKNKE